MTVLRSLVVGLLATLVLGLLATPAGSATAPVNTELPRALQEKWPV